LIEASAAYLRRDQSTFESFFFAFPRLSIRLITFLWISGGGFYIVGFDFV